MTIKKRLYEGLILAVAIVLGLPMTAKANSLLQNTSAKQAFLVGGSCDPYQNNFTAEFNAWNAFLSAKKWKVYGFIDQSKETQVVNVKPFVWKDFLATLQKVQEEPVKQVLILILTHGNYENGRHGVCDQSGNYQNIGDLIPILRQFKERSIQTAIIDASCYSGYSIGQIGKDASCVMSMAGKLPGSGSISTPVAEGLHTMPTLARKASVEDVWFSVLNQSVKRLAQVPQITGMPAVVTISQTLGRTAGNHARSVPPILIKESFSKREFLNASSSELEAGQQFFVRNKTLFGRLFSQQALEGISLYLKSGDFMAISPSAASVFYLQAHPNRKDRPCANFYF